jgi:predicted esterase
MSDARTIAVTTHGRYLLVPAAADQARPAPLLIGVHGYAEDAATHLDRLKTIPGSDRWTIVSIQALHRFYRGRSEAVVASWMTSQDRDLMIRDNVAYVSAVIDQVRHEERSSDVLVFAGFSQGASMAFRAASLGPAIPRAVISLGGDIPPELDAEALKRSSSVLLGRGANDEWYTAEKFAADKGRLVSAGVEVMPLESNAAHEWTTAFSEAAGEWLARFA